MEKLRVRKVELNVIEKDNNKFIAYNELLELLFCDFRKEKEKEIESEVNNFIIKIKNKKYISFAGLGYVFKKSDDLDELNKIISQIFRVKTKITLEDKIEYGLAGLNELKNACDILGEFIHECDLKQCDLLHELESCTKTEVERIALEIKKLRKKRRTFKNRYQLLNYVNSNINDLNLKKGFFARTSNRFDEIKNEILIQQEIIYFKKDGSNKDEMSQKINELKEKYNK